MGQNHIRALNMLKGASPLYVHDQDEERIQEMQKKFDCIPLKKMEDAADKAEAVIIATPSKTHADCACFFLEKGIHCLVEKPMADTHENCLRILDAAEKGNSKLAIGHIERFNPAVRELHRLIQNKDQIFEIESSRLSYVDDRKMGIDVILDLMVHDIDVIYSLVNEDINVIGALNIEANKIDPDGYVTALLQSESGIAIKTTASRVTQNKVRLLNISGSFGYISLDYQNQSLELTRKSRVVALENNSSIQNAALDLSVEKFLIQNREPLVVELNHFIKAVRGEEEVAVTGEDSLRVLQLAWNIQNILKDKPWRISKASAA